MAARAYLEVGLLAVVLATGTACSSGGGGGSGAETGGDDGGEGGSGTGPCVVGTQEQCNECVKQAGDVCSAGMCKQEDLDLQNCSVWATYNPCIDPQTGATTIDCCQLPSKLLIDCWRKCPEMQACS